MNQSSLLGQPIELLVKQLSDPEITLEDFNNFCNSSSKLREISRTNPLFIGLRERKTPIIDVEVKFTKGYEKEGKKNIRTTFDSTTIFNRTVTIKFYSRMKGFILTNTLIFRRFCVHLMDIEKDYIPSNMEEFKIKYKNLKSLRKADCLGYGDLGDLEYFEKFKTNGLWNVESDVYIELITKGGDTKLVKLYGQHFSNATSEFLIPLDLLESAISVARTISDKFSSGSATIALSGAVIYGENTGVEIV